MFTPSVSNHFTSPSFPSPPLLSPTLPPFSFSLLPSLPPPLPFPPSGAGLRVINYNLGCTTSVITPLLFTTFFFYSTLSHAAARGDEGRVTRPIARMKDEGMMTRRKEGNGREGREGEKNVKQEGNIDEEITVWDERRKDGIM